jgi:PKD repeat protein
VQFTDISTGIPTSWAWNFGDGQTSTSQNPTHVYSVAGTYSVNLTATNSAGSGSTTKNNYTIVVWNPGEGSGNPRVDFFPESTALTKNTDESVTFNVYLGQLPNTNWFINGKLVQNNSTTMTKSWNTSGKYNVTFSGSASGKSVLHSWFVDVISSSNYQPLDVNEDGFVDILDFSLVAKQYGRETTDVPDPRVDVNQDGVINITDLDLFGSFL